MPGVNNDALVRPGPLGKALAGRLDDECWLDLDAQLITGGKSNLTFRLTSAAGELILRRPPTGKLLPRAHDMGREVRVQRALRGSAVPVAEIVLFESEAGLLDVPFYVMECVPGLVLRDELPAGVAPGSATTRLIGESIADTLAALHALDVAELGMTDFGRPDGYATRQVRTWWRQYEAAQTRVLPVVDELYRQLAEHAWRPAPKSAVVHGDYRLDNCLIALEPQPAVCGVLDWELSTLGDPLCDLGTLLYFWVEPGEPEPLLTPALTATGGFPSRRELAERYAQAAGCDLDDLGAYLALAHFKFVGIAQGIASRVAAGQMAGQDFGDIDTEIERVATAGLAALKGLH